MQDAISLDTLKDGLARFGDATTTLYVPKPLVQIGGEKWRILRKNLIDDLADHAPQAKQAAEILEGMELEDFRGEGFVIFEEGDNVRTAHLNSRPAAMLETDARPFALPLLRDIGSRQTAWILALDKEEPRLFLYSGGDLLDHSARLRTRDGNDDEPVTMDTIQDRREVQNDFFFHNGSRGRVRSADARSTYHALGADVDAEEEKTVDAYYQLVIDALKFGLPFQVQELYVMGTEKVVGRFCQLAEGDLGKDFELHQIHNGDASQETIIQEVESALPDTTTLPDVLTITDMDTLREACTEGRVGELYVRDDLSGFDPVSEEGSEHVRLLRVGERFGEDLADITPHNAIVLDALAQGAQIVFADSDVVGGAALRGVMRWAKDSDPEGVSPEEDVEMMDEAARRQAAE